MGSVKINFAEVEDSFAAVPEGSYPVVIDKVEVRESKSSDNNYFNWELTISEGEHEGQKLWMITSLSEKALFRLKDVFDNLGVLDDEMELEWDEDVQITPQAGPLLINPDVSGLAAIAVVHNEMWEGKEQNRVNDLRAADADERPASSSRASGAAKKSSGGGAKKRQLR